VLTPAVVNDTLKAVHVPASDKSTEQKNGIARKLCRSQNISNAILFLIGKIN